MSYVVQILFARWAGPEAYGIYSYTLGWLAILPVVATLGLPETLVRFIPEYRTGRKWEYLHGLLRVSERAVAALGAILTLCSVLVVFFLSDTINPALGTALMVGLCFLPFFALGSLQQSMCRALSQFGFAYVLPRLGRPSLMLIGAAGVLWWSPDLFSGSVAVVVTGASLIPVWMVQRWAFRNHLADSAQKAPPRYRLKHWMRVAGPLLLISGFVSLLNRTDLLLAGVFLPPREVGIYRVASRTASLVGFVLTAVNAVAAPQFAALSADSDRDQMQRLVTTLAHWLFWPSVLGAGLLLVLSDYILGLFGPAFLAARLPMALLLLGHLFNAGAGSVGYLLNMTGHQTSTAWVFGVSACLNIGLNVVGLWLFGLAGAAAATALSMVVWNIWLYHLVTRKLDIYPSIVTAIQRTIR
jgi:O-antigen/teichoic acid export membrane protein